MTTTRLRKLLWTAISINSISLSFILGTSAAQAAPDNATNSANWMEQTASYIQSKKLNEIALPASHDSAMFDPVSTYNRPVSDAFAPDVDSGFTKLGSFIGVAEKWSKTQERNISEQLNDGIRALDLRTCVEKNGTLRTCHGLYGSKTVDVLREVKQFADSHPKEILILSFNRASETAPGTMSKAKHDELLALIQSELQSNLIDHSSITPTSTLQEVWSRQPGKSIIIVYAYPAEVTNRSFWGKDKTVGTWEERWGMVQKKDSLNSKLQEAASPEHQDKLVYFSGEATPDTKLIGLAALPGYPSSLKDLADQTNPVMLGWLKNEWAKQRLNLISLDFYNKTCLVPVTHVLNGVPNISLSGCNIGDTTKWADLKGAISCPSGFRDDGLYCAKPNPVIRPRPSFAWKFGDGLNDGGMFKRCEKDYGQGNCKKLGAIVYGQCRAGYTPDAPGLSCVVRCPSGMTDIGVSCKK